MSAPTPDLALRIVGDVVVVRILIEDLLSLPDTSRIEQRLIQIVQQGTRKMVLDLGAVRVAGSAALAMLLGVRLALENGGRLVLVRTEGIGDLLRLSKTAKLFQLARSVDEACDLITLGE
jgi:anti-anti-sigma factor